MSTGDILRCQQRCGAYLLAKKTCGILICGEDINTATPLMYSTVGTL